MFAANSGAASDDKTYVEDVFSTYLYAGNGSTQTINNGIDIAGKGGMVWIKYRGATDHAIFDTLRGTGNFIPSNSTVAGYSNNTTLTSFNSNGFSLGSDSSTAVNFSGFNYASWTFRKAPKFFDVVTWTGNSVSNRAISHSLGQTPGMIIVKKISESSNWVVWHRSFAGPTYSMYLNTTAGVSNADLFGTSSPTSASFYVQAFSPMNETGQTYVAYLFAHDTTTDGLIQCGTFTHSSDTDLVDLGWEPQYVLVKSTSTTGDWMVYDTSRGMNVQGSQILRPNTNGIETGNTVDASACIVPDARGFYHKQFGFNTYIYMAIRRPMKVPTDGTKVFMPFTRNGTGTTTTVNTTLNGPDTVIWKNRTANYEGAWIDRLRGGNLLVSSATYNESNITDIPSNTFSNQTGYVVSLNRTSYNSTSYSYANWAFKRAPGFFDVVCYTGTGAARTVNHNLGVAPELMIVKRRDAINSWFVYAAPRGANEYGLVNFSDAFVTPASLQWNSTAPTASVFTVGTATGVNASAGTYVAYLFASCPGVCKIGSYTATNTQTIVDCGFTNGARFVMIKRVDSTGDWFVWDTARGITGSGSSYDPHLKFNTTDAEVTNVDSIDPYAPGFKANYRMEADVSYPGGTYIYLAIA